MYRNAGQQPSRIVLAIETRLLREMLRHAIDKAPDLRLVAEVTHGADLAAAVEQEDAQWVIMSLPPDGDLPGAAEALLAAEPTLGILAVAPDGSQVKLGWKQPYRRPAAGAQDRNRAGSGWTEAREVFLQDLSLDGLISVLRAGPIWEPVEHKHEQRQSQQ